MNYKSYGMLSEDIKNGLYKVHSGNYDLIVGVPRSGMVPAYIIGLYLNIDVIDLNGYINNLSLPKGITRRSKHKMVNAHDAQRVLLVDDSILSGRSMAKALEKIPRDLKAKISTLAVYSDSQHRPDVDLFIQTVNAPRVFEWNIFHHSVLEKACVDIDGVLCVDPTEDENDDGEKYNEFMLNANPHIIPTYKIHSLVTNRLEKYRAQTEFWLAKHGIEYENLVMLDLLSKEERRQQGVHGKHKASYYKSKTELVLFIESDFKQADEIMQLSVKPVYCVEQNLMLQPGMVSFATRSPLQFTRKMRSNLFRRIPRAVKDFLRPAYKRFLR